MANKNNPYEELSEMIKEVNEKSKMEKEKTKASKASQKKVNTANSSTKAGLKNENEDKNDSFSNPYNLGQAQNLNQDGESLVAKKTSYISLKLAIALGVLIIFVSVFFSVLIANSINNNQGPINIKSTGTYDMAEAIAAKAIKGTVGVVATRTVQVNNSNPFGDFFGGSQAPETQTQSALGTGFVVDENGYIVTNSHVVLDGDANSLTVFLSDGSYTTAKLLYNDTSLDVAVIKINKSGLTPLTLGDSDKLNQGEFICAIGNPEGLEFNGTVTQGIISGLNRKIQITSDNATTIMDNLIQIDAAINGGNSGGPLLNKTGEVVGINTAKAQTSSSGSNLEGMGFAIPINTVKTIIESVKKDGTYERPMLGITTLELSQAISQGLVVEQNLSVDAGVYVYGVENNSPAKKAGIAKGDIIVKVEDKEVSTNSQIVKELDKKKSGDTITVVFYRGSTKKTVKVKLTNIVSNT